MKLYVSISGLTKITVLNDANVAVFSKSVPLMKAEEVLNSLPVTFSEQDVTRVFVDGPAKVIPKLLQTIRPKYTKAMYCVNGGTI